MKLGLIALFLLSLAACSTITLPVVNTATEPADCIDDGEELQCADWGMTVKLERDDISFNAEGQEK